MHWSGHEYQASVFCRKSLPIIHELFNDCSWCNEQSYSGEKCLPSPGIEPKTFRFPCRCANHYATRLGWLNKEKLRHTTCNCAVGTSTGLCNGDDSGRCKWQLRMWHVVQHIILALSVQALLWQGLLGKAVRLDEPQTVWSIVWCLSSDENRERSSSAPFVGKTGRRSFPTEAGDLQGGAEHWCIDQDMSTKQVCFVSWALYHINMEMVEICQAILVIVMWL